MNKKTYIGVKKRYDKSHLKMVKNKGYEGVVYIYILNAPGDEKTDGYMLDALQKRKHAAANGTRPKTSMPGRR